MLMRSLSLACMIWLFAETQQEMRLLASDWLANPAEDSGWFSSLFKPGLRPRKRFQSTSSSVIFAELVLSSSNFHRVQTKF